MLTVEQECRRTCNHVSSCIEGQTAARVCGRRCEHLDGCAQNRTDVGGRDRQKLFWVVGTIGAIGFLGLLLYMIGALQEPAPTSADIEAVAQRWVESNVDALGEDIARFLVGENWLLEELGGEYIESRIHDVVRWDYAVTWPPPADDGRNYQATATAHTEFDVDVPLLGSGKISASLPFLLTVDWKERTVSKSDARFALATFDSDIPAVKKAAEVVEQVQDAMADLEEGNCLAAAERAGVSDDVLALFKKPVEDLNFVERGLVKGAIAAAGLSERCADFGE